MDSNVGWRSMVIYGDAAEDGWTGDPPLDGDGAETLVPGDIDMGGTGAGGDRVASIREERALAETERRRRDQFERS